MDLGHQKFVCKNCGFYVIYMCKPKDFYNINTFIDFINKENDELFGIQNDNEDKTN